MTLQEIENRILAQDLVVDIVDYDDLVFLRKHYQLAEHIIGYFLIGREDGQFGLAIEANFKTDNVLSSKILIDMLQKEKELH